MRLFGWGRAAGHKAIVRLFQRFDQLNQLFTLTLKLTCPVEAEFKLPPNCH